jgi:FixJ family two-component response regulator
MQGGHFQLVLERVIGNEAKIIACDLTFSERGRVLHTVNVAKKTQDTVQTELGEEVE